MAPGVEARGGKATLPERVAQLYYSLGLFCSSYPVSVIFGAITVVFICCYPLVNLPLPGTLPLQVSAPNNDTEPWCYVQQIVVRSAVVPWSKNLSLNDAFRAPLYEVFKLLEIVRNFHKGGTTLGHLCLHVEAVKRPGGDGALLPEYSCLILSPANFWQLDVQNFNQDKHLLTTIFNYQNIQKGKISFSELLFGMSLKDAGIKRYPLRNRQRVLQFAITLLFKHYDPQFIAALKEKLKLLYPLHQNNLTLDKNEIIYIYFPGVFNYYEFIPLFLSFLILFFYIYFSVRKIEIIKSKIGVAVSAVITVLGSLGMSVGLCFFFGLTLSLQGKEIFPYLVILVGLENILVLTKSIVSTPQHLDIKIRVAQGLSREGWSITKNILVEITILTIGLATFVPVIQEFCIFAITALISDFYLQMFFFSTILSIDIHRMELSVEKTHSNFRNSLYQSQNQYDKLIFNSRGIVRSKSHPKLTNISNFVSGKSQNLDKKMPKRLRLVHIWARTRFFQRSFMIWMIVWISIIVYNSGIFDVDPPIKSDKFQLKNRSKTLINLPSNLLDVNKVPTTAAADELALLRHPLSNYPRIPAQHWPVLFASYNMSLSGNRIGILPEIKISNAVSPEQAAMLRNFDENYDGHSFQWHSLAAALDPIDFYELNNGKSASHESPHGTNLSPIDQPFYPHSPMEIFLATILCAISVIVVAYAMVVLYRCVCTRNYAEWRTSWGTTDKGDEIGATHLVMDAVPLVLDGHYQEVECLVTDGSSVVSSCLGGQIKVWDSATGERIAEIDRKVYFNSTSSPNTSVEPDDSLLSDYESGSPPSRDENTPLFPSLQSTINTNFSNLKLEPVTQNRSYDFGAQFRQLYTKNHQINFNLKQNCENKSKNSPKKMKSSANCVPPIWCIDFLDNLVVLGCANGRVEFWDGITAKLKCIFEDGTGIGVTSLKLIGSRVILAKLNGSLDFLQLQTFNQGNPVDWRFSSTYRRTHIRSGSAGSVLDFNCFSSETDLRCIKLQSHRAHQQPITVLDSEGGKIVTGSQDHTLKIFRLDDPSLGALYTLHGHFGPITCLFIDRISPQTSGSGSQDGLLCVWDLSSGTCVFSVQAHDGAINSLSYSASYVISLGVDEKMCVWERFQGHLLQTIAVPHIYSSCILMLTHNFVITARQGSLAILDVRTGETVKIVPLGHRDASVFVKQLLLLRDGSIICDYGPQLRIVRFPLITHKFE